MADDGKELATLAGGCFWCLEAVFDRVRGVERVESGYIGGGVPHPSYELVCTGTTGHAEAVRLTFDPAVISFSELLEIFFVIHDPTTLNRQGHDSGTQYRSAVFHHSAEQRDDARRAIAALEVAGVWRKPIVTQIEPVAAWYPAEGYHQRYYEQNPSLPYCQVVISPKVAKLRKEFAHKLTTAYHGGIRTTPVRL